MPLQLPDWSIDFDACAPRSARRRAASSSARRRIPCGKVFTRDELEKIAALAHEHDLLVITDEIYEYIVYDGRGTSRRPTRRDLRDRTVTHQRLLEDVLHHRLAHRLRRRADAPLARPIGLVNDLFYVCAPTPLQHGVIAGFDAAARSFFQELAGGLPGQARPHLRRARCRRPDARSCRRARTTCSPTSAGWASRTPARAAMALLEGCGVAAVPGTSFYRGRTGDRLLRFCFAVEAGLLEEACQRIRSWRV